MFLRSLIFTLIGTVMYINCATEEISYIKEFESLFQDKEKNSENAALIYDEEISKSAKPVMIKYFMHECGECKSVKKTFEKLAKEFHDKVTFIAIDIEKFEPLCDSKDIFSVPAFTYILNGKEVARDMGPKSLGDLKFHLKQNFKL